MFDLNYIKSRIKQARIDCGMTQNAVSEKLRVKRETVSTWESGKNCPSIACLAELADIFKCDIEYLLGRCEEKHLATADVVESTGLSEQSVERLIVCKNFGDKSLTRPLDALIHDWEWVNESGANDGRKYRSLLDLLLFFLEYRPTTENKMAVFANGSVVLAENRQIVGTAVILDAQMVENAVLLEIQRALLSLRENLEKEKKPPEKGSKEGKKNATNQK